MELHNLEPAKGSIKKKKRIARGQGSGRSGTSTRGHKGAKSRSGYSRKVNFEGGQMPLQQRLPKRGFKNPFRTEYVGINLDRLMYIAEKMKTNSVNIETLYTSGTIKPNDKVKILGDGEITKAINIEAHAISKSAQQALEKAGGTFTAI